VDGHWLQLSGRIENLRQSRCETEELRELKYVPSTERSHQVRLIRLRWRRDGDRKTFAVANGIGEPDFIADFWTISEAKGCVWKGIYDFEEV